MGGAAALGAGGTAPLAMAAPRPDRASGGVRFAGSSVGIGDPDYETRRESLVWQAIKPAGRPQRIYACASASDVAAVVAEARRQNRPVSVAAGGHSYVGNGLHDGALLVDLAAMDAVAIDAPARRAALGPAVRAFDLDARLSERGLAFPIAHNSTVGLGGYLLGGGMGWNAESYGNLACSTLRAVDVVLASGEQVRADESRHADLLWAARGGGPLFPAIVTRFHVDVFPRPQAIRETTLVYAADAAPAVVAWLEQARAQQDPKVDLTLIFAQGDPAQGAPPGLQGVISIVCFAQDQAEAERLHAPIIAGAPPAPLFREELAPRTIADLLLADKASMPVRHSVQTLWTNDPQAAALRIAEAMQGAPSAGTLGYINYRARATVPPGGAYSRIGQAFVYVDTIWEEAADDAANQAWADALIASLRPIDVGAYVNETEYRRHPARLRDCYSPESLERLLAVARAYDPDGRFVRPAIV